MNMFQNWYHPNSELLEYCGTIQKSLLLASKDWCSNCETFMCKKCSSPQQVDIFSEPSHFSNPEVIFRPEPGQSSSLNQIGGSQLPANYSHTWNKSPNECHSQNFQISSQLTPLINFDENKPKLKSAAMESKDIFELTKNLQSNKHADRDDKNELLCYFDLTCNDGNNGIGTEDIFGNDQEGDGTPSVLKLFKQYHNGAKNKERSDVSFPSNYNIENLTPIEAKALLDDGAIDEISDGLDKNWWKEVKNTTYESGNNFTAKPQGVKKRCLEQLPLQSWREKDGENPKKRLESCEEASLLKKQIKNTTFESGKEVKNVILESGEPLNGSKDVKNTELSIPKRTLESCDWASLLKKDWKNLTYKNGEAVKNVTKESERRQKEDVDEKNLKFPVPKRKMEPRDYTSILNKELLRMRNTTYESGKVEKNVIKESVGPQKEYLQELPLQNNKDGNKENPKTLLETNIDTTFKYGVDDFTNEHRGPQGSSKQLPLQNLYLKDDYASGEVQNTNVSDPKRRLESCKGASLLKLLAEGTKEEGNAKEFLQKNGFHDLNLKNCAISSKKGGLGKILENFTSLNF